MLEVTKETFEAEVLQAEGKVLVDFYGNGCEPCAALRPYIEEYEEQFSDQIKFCALNTSKARRLAIGQKVLGLPVIAVYENGEQVDAKVKEEATPESILDMLKAQVSQ